VKNNNPAVLVPGIERLIVTLRGDRLLLDADLARIYGVPTYRFNEAVKRNHDRFPPDFMFRLSQEEWTNVQALRSQIAILKTGRGAHRKYLPSAETASAAGTTARSAKTRNRFPRQRGRGPLPAIAATASGAKPPNLTPS
jgi:hypothetical protein